MDHTNQLLLALNKEEEGDLPSLPKSNLERPHLAQNFNDLQNFPEQPIIILEDKMVIEQSNNLTRSKIYEKSEWRDEPLPSSSCLPMAQIPSDPKLSTTFTEKGEQIGVMMELIETSQGSQIHNTIEEVAHKSLSQDSLNPCLADIEMDDFDVDGCDTEMNDLVETPYPNNTPSLIEKYEPSPNSPITPLLESSPDPELKTLPITSMDTLPMIYDQESQIVDVLKAHQEAIGWNIADMRNNDFKILISDLSEFGTTFEDCLQN